MGGFHGGHSSGGFHGGHSSGGFHSGHSSGSFHSSGGYRAPHHSTFVYIGGNRYNSGWNNYNNSYKKPALLSSIVIATIILFIGIFLFLAFYKVETTAKITSAYISTDVNGIDYEKYEFEYVFNDKKYIGYGDDDLKYNYVTHTYEFVTKVGEEYPLYVGIISPGDYSFERDNSVPRLILGVNIVISAAIIISTVSNLKRYKELLSSIGDLNGDGKLDEKDIMLYLKKKQNTNSEEESKPKYKKCPYCDSFVPIEAKFCEQCGAAQTL